MEIREVAMTAAQALEKARTIWAAHAGWAVESERDKYDRHGNLTVERVCDVGILEPTPHGVAHRTLGSGKTFEIAFERAARAIERQREHRTRKREPEGWPQVEIALP